MALWTPADAPTSLWLDNSDQNTLFDATTGGAMVLPGGVIARMEDKSGNARHFTNTTSTARPTWQTNQQNGLAVGRYDGTNDRMLGNSASLNMTSSKSAMYLLIAVKADNYTAGPRLFSATPNGSSTTVRFGLSLNSNKWRLGTRRLDSNTITSLLSPGDADNTWNLVAGLVNLSLFTSDTAKLFVNGTEVATTSLPGTSPVTSSGNSSAVYIGSLSTESYLNGSIGDIVFLDYLPSLLLRQTFEGCLAHKWGIQSKLDASHPYRFTPPGAGAIDSRRRRFALGGYGL